MKKKIEFLIRLIPVFSISCLIAAFIIGVGMDEKVTAAGVAYLGLIGMVVYFVFGCLFWLIDPKV